MTNYPAPTVTQQRTDMHTATPTVTLIASTALTTYDTPDGPAARIAPTMDVQPGSTDAESLVTFAGRSCYQSFHRPNPDTAQDGDYLAKTLFGDKHWSIAEHATATFYLTGVSRALTHELVRHRHLSYSQLSQRFVDEGQANIVLPPAIRDLESKPAEGAGTFDATTNVDQVLDAVSDAAYEARTSYDTITTVLSEAGYTRKQAREAARAVLPNMTETRIVVTGNLRAWHEVIDRRSQPDADAEFQQVARMIQQLLHDNVSTTIFPRPDAL